MCWDERRWPSPLRTIRLLDGICVRPFYLFILTVYQTQRLDQQSTIRSELNHRQNHNNSSLTVLGYNMTVVALTPSGDPQIYLGRLDTSLIDTAEDSCSNGYTLSLRPDKTILYWLIFYGIVCDLRWMQRQIYQPSVRCCRASALTSARLRRFLISRVSTSLVSLRPCMMTGKYASGWTPDRSGT